MHGSLQQQDRQEKDADRIPPSAQMSWQGTNVGADVSAIGACVASSLLGLSHRAYGVCGSLGHWSQTTCARA